MSQVQDLANIRYHNNVFTEAHERLMDIYERLDDMDSDKAEVKAAELLNGTLHLFVSTINYNLGITVLRL